MPNPTKPTKRIDNSDGLPTPTREEVVTEYRERIKTIMNSHYQQLVKELNDTTNIANRYDTKLKLDELLYVFKLIMGE